MSHKLNWAKTPQSSFLWTSDCHISKDLQICLEGAHAKERTEGPGQAFGYASDSA
jgi:hypothetical protein